METNVAQNSGAFAANVNAHVNMQYAKSVVGTATTATSGVKK